MGHAAQSELSISFDPSMLNPSWWYLRDGVIIVLMVLELVANGTHHQMAGACG